MTKIARPTLRLETRRRFDPVRRILGVGAVVAAMALLAGCASGPSLATSDAGPDAAWEGAVKPKKVSMSSPSRIGSQPLLPPVPEDTNGLAPIKISALTE